MKNVFYESEIQNMHENKNEKVYHDLTAQKDFLKKLDALSSRDCSSSFFNSSLKALKV